MSDPFDIQDLGDVGLPPEVDEKVARMAAQAKQEIETSRKEGRDQPLSDFAASKQIK